MVTGEVCDPVVGARRRSSGSSSLFDQWRESLLTGTGSGRRRLPRDVIATVFGAALATSAWLLLANGVGQSTWFRTSIGNSWIVALPAILGTVVVIGCSLAVSALGHRWWLIAETVGSSVTAAAGCAVVGHLLQIGSGHASAPPLVAATTAASVLFARELKVALRSSWWSVVIVGLVAETIHSDALPLGAVGAIGMGIVTGSVVLVVLGTRNGLPNSESVVELMDQLGLRIASIKDSETSPTWGSARFYGQEDSGASVSVDVFGRDVPEGQFIARLWRFLWARRSTLEFRARPTDHIERVVGLIHWVRALGLSSADVVVAKRIERSGDAVLVTRPPAGNQLASLDQSEVGGSCLESIWRALQVIGDAGIALHRIRASEILLVPGRGACFTDFSQGEALATRQDRDTDIALLLAETARVTDPVTAVRACLGVVGQDRLLRAAPLVQSHLVPRLKKNTTRAEDKEEFEILRHTVAEAIGTDSIEPVPLARIQPQKLGTLALTFIGIWLLIEQLAGFGNIHDVLEDAQWIWVLLALVLAQSTLLTEAVSLSGAVPTQLPLGLLALLRSATDFTGLVGGTVGRTATIIRFYQRRGLSRSIAVSSGVIFSVAGFIVQIVLGVTALIFAIDEFTSTSPGPPGSDSDLLLKILIVIVVLGVIGSALFSVPKVRRIFDSRVRPEMSSAWSNLSNLVNDPAKLLRIFGGQGMSQVLAALSLGAALHAVGGEASIAGLLVIWTLASLLGGLAPVPGGMGVMEATYISGLTLLGVPEDVAIGATLLYRLCTAYLPPIWGWVSLVWLKRHEMV